MLGLAAPQVATAQEPTAIGRGGGAATVDAAGTQAAIRALRQGGNAVDAAVAAAAVLGVTEPYSCGIGGGGFMVIRTPDGKVTTIDSREESPAAMRPDSFFVDGEPPDPPMTRTSTPRATADCRPACPGPSRAGTRRCAAMAAGR